MDCDLGKCVGRVEGETFRDALRCIVSNVAKNTVVVDNGQQYTLMIYANASSAEELKSIDEYLTKCIDAMKQTKFGEYVSDVKVIRNSDQLIMIFKREIIAIRALLG